MTTFSQLVDKMIQETKRPDLLQQIASYLNQTLRELHMEPMRGKAIFLRDNLKEDIVYANSDQGFSWAVPDQAVFQGMAGVRFDSVIDQDGNAVWAIEMMSPNRAMNSRQHWFYRSGQTVYFKNYGGNNALLSLSWYEYTKSLPYFAAAARPMTLDDFGVATYHVDYDVDATTRADAAAKTTNWILRRWDTLVEEGVRAKIYKRLSDTERARTSYSMYQTLREGFISAEQADVSGSW